MSKPKNVVPIAPGMADYDPGDFTISVGSVPFRFLMGPNGRSTMIGPARIIEFPRTGVSKKLAKSVQGGDECPDRGGRRTRRTKMKKRRSPVNRVGKCIQTPEAAAISIAPQTPHDAPEEAPAKNKTTRAKKTSKAATNASAPREESKTSQVIAMLKREGGTSLEGIMTAMGWQKHTTRAMLSAGGSLTKKHGLVIISEKIGDKRTYSIKA
jgi:hypothetical protein